MLAFLLATCAQALNPAALAREALVEYRANEERIAPDKVLACVLRNNQCTDSERRAAAESFLGTAARLRRYEWLCRDIQGDSEEVAAALLRARDEDAEEVAATLLRARDEDRTPTEWPSDPNERLSVESGAPLSTLSRSFGPEGHSVVVRSSSLAWSNDAAIS